MKINLGFSSLLTLLFVIAKLTGYVSWSWWVVFCPVIISAAVVTLILGLAAAATLAVILFDMKK